MDRGFLDRLAGQTDELKGAGLFKPERVLSSPQQPVVRLADGREVLNLCANNYLGLADHPAVIAAAHAGARPLRLRHGLGALHLRHAGPAQAARGAAQRLPRHRGHHPLLLVLRRQRRPVRDAARTSRTPSSATRSTTPPSSTASACARRSGYRYANNDMADLEAQLEEARRRARFKLIATDGVFSMDGVIAQPARHLRPRRPATTRWSWSTTPTPIGFIGPAAAAARRSTAA